MRAVYYKSSYAFTHSMRQNRERADAPAVTHSPIWAHLRAC
jgi:hypothetical protein